ncbi:MAG: glutamate cyclase domain-containing protein [Gemmataceae bacterium]
MTDQRLDKIRALIQEDVANRGLCRQPIGNMVDSCPGDFAAACHSIARTQNAALGVVTGFYIADADPPCGETDGPLGALFLARSLMPLGIEVHLITDPFCTRALAAGLRICRLEKRVEVLALPPRPDSWDSFLKGEWRRLAEERKLTHLLALERVGPSHTLDSIRAQNARPPEATELFEAEVAEEHRNRCHSMNGRDISDLMAPAYRLFENAAECTHIVTIGIGDGGNEIGMGKIAWDIVRRNVARGGVIACRVLTDYLIVCGISNWGAYGLAAGVRFLRGAAPDQELFGVEFERELLQIMVQEGPLVDGVTRKQGLSVDGLAFDRYAEPLRQLADSI